MLILWQSRSALAYGVFARPVMTLQIPRPLPENEPAVGLAVCVQFVSEMGRGF